MKCIALYITKSIHSDIKKDTGNIHILHKCLTPWTSAASVDSLVVRAPVVFFGLSKYSMSCLINARNDD